MGGFVAKWLVSFFWVAALCPAVNSKIPTCTKLAPVCSSALYPLCVYSEDCEPAWECVPLSNILQSIFTHFRCHPTNSPATETKPCPTASKPEPSPPSANQDSKDKLGTESSQTDSGEQAIPESDRSAEDSKNAPVSPSGVKQSSTSLKSAPSGARTLDTPQTDMGSTTKDTSTSEYTVGVASVPKTDLPIEQLFDGDVIAKFKPFPQNKINSGYPKKGESAPLQIDWSGFGFVESAPSGKSGSKQLKTGAPQLKPSDLKLQTVETNVANTPSALAGIDSVDPGSIRLENPPIERKDPTQSAKKSGHTTTSQPGEVQPKHSGSNTPDSQKSRSSGSIPGNQVTSGQLGLPVDTKSHGTKALGNDEAVEPKVRVINVDHDQKLDSKVNTKTTTQLKNEPKDDETEVSHEDVEGQRKLDTEPTNSESSESQEVDSHQLEHNGPNIDRSPSSQMPGGGGLVNPVSTSQIETAPQPTLLSVVKPPSETTAGQHSELLPQGSEGEGHPELGSSLPEALENNPDRQTPSKPDIPTRKDGSSDQKKDGTTAGVVPAQETAESSSPKPLLQPVHDSSRSLNSESHKNPVGSKSVQAGNPPSDKHPRKRKHRSSHKRRQKNDASNRNTKSG